MKFRVARNSKQAPEYATQRAPGFLKPHIDSSETTNSTTEQGISTPKPEHIDYLQLHGECI